MELKDFKLIKNRQRPEQCYSYELKKDGRKYSMFTMNTGSTFLATIEEQRGDRRYYEEFSGTYQNTEQSIQAFKQFDGI